MLNICIFEGRLTRDPDIKKTASGLTIANFTIAVDRTIKRNGEKTALFLPCTFFGNQAENIAKWREKGSVVQVIGRLDVNVYTDRMGNRKETMCLIGDRFEFPTASSKNDGESQGQQPQPQVKQSSAIGFTQPTAREGGEQEKAVDSLDIVDDDLPF